MRNRIIALVLLLGALHGAEIEAFAEKNRYFTDYEKALLQAKSEGKMVMLAMVSHYCPWCRKMERRVLSNKKVNKEVHEALIPLILNRQKDRFPKQFDTPRVPTIFFIDPNNENLVWETIGFIKKKDFLEAVAEAKKLYKNQKKSVQ